MFAEQQTSITIYRLPAKENQQFAIFVFRLLYLNGSIYVPYAAVSKGRRKPKQFSLYRLPVAHRAKGSLSVYLQRNK